MHCLMLENCKLFARAFHLKNDKGLNFVYDKNIDAVVGFFSLSLSIALVLCFGSKQLYD